MWVARADESIKQVVMAYLGVQFKGEDKRADALAAMRTIVASFDAPDGPLHYDLTHHEDNQGHQNLMIVGYWKDPPLHFYLPPITNPPSLSNLPILKPAILITPPVTIPNTLMKGRLRAH
jgi:hypothetical protein